MLLGMARLKEESEILLKPAVKEAKFAFLSVRLGKHKVSIMCRALGVIK